MSMYVLYVGYVYPLIPVTIARFRYPSGDGGWWSPPQ